MDVDILQMDPRVASIYYRDYRHKVRANRDSRRKELEQKAKAAGKELGRIRIEKTRMDHEDEELMRAYAAMKKGERIININSVMRKAGVDKQKHLPLLAICRADAEWCGFVIRQDDPYFKSKGTYKKDGEVRITGQPFPAETYNTEWRRGQKLPIYNIYAMVPRIPAHLTPSDSLSNYHILWEAKWEHIPPVDPLLLKHVGGNIYTVLAQWDLTPIEQTVLGARTR